ncbi:MAG: ribonuclease H-like domain-containing protein [Chitinophagales bacterium]|nr:ribonuclease H-like domain-containing protein [Chitinophagaceae bacterium]MCB9064873.1 ribonuclease H-like domain-containing protein [Chitinophagales bacterium]
MQPHQHILFFDIETVPLTDDYDMLSERMHIEWEKKAKFLQRGDEEQEPGKLFEEKAGVFAEFAKVVCICFGSFQFQDGAWKMRMKALVNDDENLLLREFADVVNRFHAYNQQMAFCGHNIKEFDVPFLCRRMLINHIPIPDVMNLSGKKPWENPNIDTLELWKFGDYKNYTSLALLAEIMGIPSPKSDIDGSMVASVYYKDKDLPRIAKYCLQDVVTSARVYLRLKGLSSEFETVTVED